MAEIASAFVSLVPSMRGFGRAVERQMGPVGDRAGQQFGQDFNDAASAEVTGGGGLGNLPAEGEGIGAKFGKLFGAAAAIGISAAVVGSVNEAINQGAIVDKFAAALGQTPKQSAKFGKIAGDLYANAYGESFEDVASAVATVQSSFQNLGGKQLKTVSAQALDFASIFDIELPRALSVSSTLVKQGLAKNATQALDLLTASAQKVPAALRENILDAADEYGQFFKNVGFSGPEAFNALTKSAALGEFGIDKTGDAIKEFTIRATDMSTTSVAAFDSIGLDAGKMANAILKGGDTAGRATDKIVKGLLGIEDPATQANTAIALFGTPLEDLGVKNIPTFLRSLEKGGNGLGDFNGAINRAGATLADNAATNLEAFKRTFTQTFVEVIGGKIVPFIEGTLVPAALSIGNAFRDNLGPAVEAVSGFFGDVFAKLSPVGDFLKANPAFVKAFAVALGALGAAIGAVTLATAAFSVALNSTGIPLVIIGIAALVAGLVVAYQRSEQFRNIVNQVGLAVRDFASFVQTNVIPVVVGIAQKIGQNLRPVVEQLGRTFRDTVLPALQNAVTKFRELQPSIQRIVVAVVKLVGRLADFYTTVLSKVLPVLIRFTGFVLGKAIPAIAAYIGSIVKIISKVIELGNAFVRGQQRINGAVNKIVDKVGEIFTEIKSIPGKVTGALGDLSGLLVNAGRSIIQGLINGIGQMVKPLTDKLGAITKLIPKNKGPESKDKKLLVPAGLLIMQGLIKGLDNGQKALKEKLRRITGTIKGEFDNIKSAISSLGSTVADAFRPDLFAGSVGDFFANGSLGIANIKAVRGALEKLRGFGVSPAFLSQLFSSGNADLILSLAGSKGTAKQAQGIFDQTNNLSRSLGNAVGNNEYRDDLERLGDRFERAVENLGKRGDKRAQKTANAFAAAINGAATRGQKGRAA